MSIKYAQITCEYDFAEIKKEFKNNPTKTKKKYKLTKRDCERMDGFI